MGRVRWLRLCGDGFQNPPIAIAAMGGARDVLCGLVMGEPPPLYDSSGCRFAFCWTFNDYGLADEARAICSFAPSESPLNSNKRANHVANDGATLLSRERC